MVQWLPLDVSSWGVWVDSPEADPPPSEADRPSLPPPGQTDAFENTIFICGR